MTNEDLALVVEQVYLTRFEVLVHLLLGVGLIGGVPEDSRYNLVANYPPTVSDGNTLYMSNLLYVPGGEYNGGLVLGDGEELMLGDLDGLLLEESDGLLLIDADGERLGDLDGLLLTEGLCLFLGGLRPPCNPELISLSVSSFTGCLDIPFNLCELVISFLHGYIIYVELGSIIIRVTRTWPCPIVDKYH